MEKLIKLANSLLGAVLLKNSFAPNSESVGRRVECIVIYKNVLLLIFDIPNSDGSPMSCYYNDSKLIIGNKNIKNPWSIPYSIHDIFSLKFCPKNKEYLGKSRNEIIKLMKVNEV